MLDGALDCGICLQLRMSQSKVQIEGEGCARTLYSAKAAAAFCASCIVSQPSSSSGTAQVRGGGA